MKLNAIVEINGSNAREIIDEAAAWLTPEDMVAWFEGYIVDNELSDYYKIIKKHVRD